MLTGKLLFLITTETKNYVNSLPEYLHWYKMSSICPQARNYTRGEIMTSALV